jgi:hypothetical protein
MKSCCLHIIIACFLLTSSIAQLHAQKTILDKEIKLSGCTGTIEFFLDEIRAEGKIEFSYTSRVPLYRIVSVSKARQTIQAHLTEIFLKDSIDFIIRNNKILLIAERKKSHESAGPTFSYIRGKVTDKKNNKPLAYANVFILNKSLGTVTNASGDFLLNMTDIQSTDTLCVSFIGFSSFRAPLHDLDTNQLDIRLSAEQVQIHEVIVRPYDPIYIITKSLEKVTENYESEATVLTAFFRESSKQNEDNISLSEAVIKIYKESYGSERPDQVKIYKGRKGNNISHKEEIDFVVQGGLYNNLQLDIVKNGVTFLDKDYFHLYDYTMDKIIYHQERPTYVITFDQREGVNYPCYKGKIYIDVESLAIVGSDFELSKEGINYATGMYVKKCPRRLKVKPVSASYQVYYRRYNGRWNLSNVRSDLSIRVKHKKDKVQDKLNYVFESISEFVVTSRDSSNIARFKFNEISKPRDILVNQIVETDETFWGNENIIIPEEPIEKTILKLGKKEGIQFDQSFTTLKINDTIPEINYNDQR